MKRYLLVGAGLLVLIGILVGIKVAQIGKLMAMGKAMQQSGPPPEAVGSAVAQSRNLGSHALRRREHLGSAQRGGSNEVPGTSADQVRVGTDREEGQILVELDADVERAQLASAESRRELAGKTAQRSKVLAQGNVISRSQLDEVESQLKSAATDMAALRAQVERKVVRAPFPGRLGIRAVNVGSVPDAGHDGHHAGRDGRNVRGLHAAAGGAGGGRGRAARAGDDSKARKRRWTGRSAPSTRPSTWRRAT